MRKIYIAGGSGAIGGLLIERLQSEGKELVILSRSSGRGKLKYPESTLEMAKIFEDSEAVINLAGASIVGKRWTEEYKKELYTSRIDITKFLAESISHCKNPPKSFVSASAIGIYGDRGADTLTEQSSLADGFIANLCKDWEAATEAANGKTKIFIPRIGVVLHPEFGALERFLLPMKLFIGGPIGSGEQWFSWISARDLVEIIFSAIEKMNEFAKTLGKVINRPSAFRVPKFVIDLMLGEASQEVLRSQKILPAALEAKGFKFAEEDLELALKNLLN